MRGAESAVTPKATALAHAAAVVEEHLLGLFLLEALWHRQRELRREEREVLVVEVPAVVHRRTQQPLAAEQLEDVGDGEVRGRVGVRGEPSVLGSGAVFEVVDDVDAVLHDLAVGCLHARDDPAPDGGHDLVQVSVASR
jgi:hypothetical protein